MNRFTLNGAALNGAVLSLVLASASFGCEAQVSPLVRLVRGASVSVSGSAAATVQAVCTRRVVARIDGVGGVYPKAELKNAIASRFTCGASATAYVLRDIQSGAVIYGDAKVSATVADQLGQVAMSGGSALGVTATRVHRVRSDLAGVSYCAVLPSPTVYRMAATTATLGAAYVLVETTINGVAECYANFPASCSVVLDGVATRTASCDIHALADAAVNANLVQPGRVALTPTASVPTANAFIVQTSVVQMPATAQCHAQAVRVHPVATNVPCLSAMALTPVQQHSIGLVLTASADVFGAGRVARYVSAHALCFATVDAGSVRSVRPAVSVAVGSVISAEAVRSALFGVDFLCSVGVHADASRTVNPSASVAAQSAVTADVVLSKMAGASAGGSASTNATAGRSALAGLLVEGGSGVSAEAVRTASAQAAVVSTVSVSADSVRGLWSDASVECAAYVAPFAVRRVLADFSVTTEADVTADVRCWKVPTTVCTASADLQATAVRLVAPTALFSTTATVELEPLRFAVCSADIRAVADFEFNAVRIVPALAGVSGELTLTADASRTTPPNFAVLSAGATVISDAVRVLLPTAFSGATADVVIDPDGVVFLPMPAWSSYSNFNAGATVASDAVRVLPVESVVQTTAHAGATADRSVFPSCEVATLSVVTASASNTKPSFVSLSAGASVTASSSFYGTLYAFIDAGVTVTADVRFVRYGSAFLTAGAAMLADVVANAYSKDPLERTFVSPARVCDFSRPFVETEFRRAA